MTAALAHHLGGRAPRLIACEEQRLRTPPPDLDLESVAGVLSEHWNIDAPSLNYVPLGFGSHHWIAEGEDGNKWFVTVDVLRDHHSGEDERTVFEILTTAFRTAESLQNMAGLKWVIGPTATRAGEPIVRLTNQFSLAVFPHLDVEPTEFGEFRNMADRNEALRLVGQLHNATTTVPVDSLRQDTLAIPNRTRLQDALKTLDATWTAGPFSDPVRLLLREHAAAVMDKLHRSDELAGPVTGDTSAWVITHGEPHAGNVIRTRSGELVIVDWDTVAYAPRERDLWMLVSESNPDWSSYRDATGVTSLSQRALDVYQLQWDLSEIAIYVSWCRKPHERTEELEIAWESLQQYLSNGA